VLEPDGYAALRRALPGVRLVQVIHVTGREALTLAGELAGRVDALLLDSGAPAAAIPELGGTGRTHDWDLSRRIRERVERPVILAGGLTDANLAQAYRRVRPYGLDVCTGVRADGRLDEERLGAFMGAVQALRDAQGL
jgi:phosphoribosylanthranilate isomerase